MDKIGVAPECAGAEAEGVQIQRAASCYSLFHGSKKDPPITPELVRVQPGVSGGNSLGYLHAGQTSSRDRDASRRQAHRRGPANATQRAPFRLSPLARPFAPGIFLEHAT